MAVHPQKRQDELFPDVVEFRPEGPGVEEEAGAEEIDLRVRRAQEKLLLLRQQQELIERQKRELEEISRRQEELDRGREAMRDLLGRSVIQIEREMFEGEQRIEAMRQAREVLAAHLERLDAIEPKSWEPGNIRAMLSQALAEVEAARGDYERIRARLAGMQGAAAALPEDEGRETDAGEEDFLAIVRRGFAFTLPLLAAALVLAALLAAILARLPAALPGR